LASTAAQFEATSRESDPRSTADAPGAPGRIRLAASLLAATKNPRRNASRVSLILVFCVFARETEPASTVMKIRAEVRFVLLVVVLD
jgi:hypothetical protein